MNAYRFVEKLITLDYSKAMEECQLLADYQEDNYNRGVTIFHFDQLNINIIFDFNVLEFVVKLIGG